ncbi:hypothetical protein Kpol_448p6 [Vanderwaltozyma polyspora DSM 70294]|uniref:Inorganic phosphate transporter PHO86 n=1 Tax=Vanderwaltozyma polyspora (strain ATCC 22028 / DSM 70294 / BCRC 21397 / CBS 2163 / NBRC 10782 / NRRL Y-8283 / UCD 57-17) TaxID=436907 RepID=A7TQY2_VANPO|nr:uncharacterized protein Kpol_448p6 [Vanderwaltozyma polyspora DSM 70294]EDO15319.1 hypothetical protein Kpol_448p6 [Vanderwaltozyma polyspora DSM 70294]
MISGKKNLQIPQVDASLDKPLDKDAPPTIYGTSLTPELATASLNLSVDFIKQQQSIANKFLLFHPFTLFSIGTIVTLYLALNLYYPGNITSSSISGYLYQFFLLNKRQLGTGAILTLGSTSFIFTLLSRVTDAYFKSKINEVTNSNGEVIFGVNLPKLSSSNDSKEANSPQLKNTHIVVYRQTPIALVTVNENKVLSSDESLVMSMSSIGCRRVYIKSGILEDLLDWSMIRTRTIAKEGKYGQSMKLVYAIYSFDEEMKKVLLRKGFKKVQSVKIRDNRLLGGLFGIETELWGVQFRIEPTK